MSDKPGKHPVRAVRGLSRLAIEATLGVTDVVESMHQTISPVQQVLGRRPDGRTRGITGLVYSLIRGVTGLVGLGLDALLGQLEPLVEEAPTSYEREALLSALNGVLGDHLARTRNPLAIALSLRREGSALTLEREALAGVFPGATGRLLVLVHGCSMNDLQWAREGHDHGAALERDLGYTAVYARYNTGRHVSTNGRELSQHLEALVAAWPVPLEELAIVGHSMGGLVARSACRHAEDAGLGWLKYLKRMVFLGTPHHGAPLERGGHLIDLGLGLTPYSAPLARLGKIRSEGVTDLRYGNVLDEDWRGRDRFGADGDPRAPCPLPEGVACYLAAATLDEDGALPLVGDGLVPLESALGVHARPERSLEVPRDHQWVGKGMGHLELLSRREVYEVLLRWLA